mmetsp:Transcript_42714/g.84578  ORF Transcript_42714/g.84578 Transcript_42714/m.84578 type:complete len:229 (+) Transcript_42714:354-1040(+)
MQQSNLAQGILVFKRLTCFQASLHETSAQVSQRPQRASAKLFQEETEDDGALNQSTCTQFTSRLEFNQVKQGPPLCGPIIREAPERILNHILQIFLTCAKGLLKARAERCCILQSCTAALPERAAAHSMGCITQDTYRVFVIVKRPAPAHNSCGWPLRQKVFGCLSRHLHKTWKVVQHDLLELLRRFCSKQFLGRLRSAPRDNDTVFSGNAWYAEETKRRLRRHHSMD